MKKLILTLSVMASLVSVRVQSATTPSVAERMRELNTQIEHVQDTVHVALQTQTNSLNLEALAQVLAEGTNSLSALAVDDCVAAQEKKLGQIHIQMLQVDPGFGTNLSFDPEPMLSSLRLTKRSASGLRERILRLQETVEQLVHWRGLARQALTESDINARISSRLMELIQEFDNPHGAQIKANDSESDVTGDVDFKHVERAVVAEVATPTVTASAVPSQAPGYNPTMGKTVSASSRIPTVAYMTQTAVSSQDHPPAAGPQVTYYYPSQFYAPATYYYVPTVPPPRYYYYYSYPTQNRALRPPTFWRRR